MACSESFDVVIVGGRCAGAPLATLLGDSGMRVAMVDRAHFPSDVPSTHGIQPNGVKALGRLGVLDDLLQLTTPIERATLAFDDARIHINDVSALTGAPMLNIRRVTLDRILVERARAAGAQVRTETTVTGLLEQRGRVTGVQTDHGALRASLVVGADGTHSTIAQLVGAEEYGATTPGRTFLWSYLKDVGAARDHVWLGKIGDWAYLASPTDGGLFMVAVVASRDPTAALARDRTDAHAAALAAWPALQTALSGGTRVGPVRTMGRWHGYFRRSAGPGWVLLGDAGHFKDPSPGQGISDAFRQAEHLADAIRRAFSGTNTPDRILHEWWTWRDRDAWGMYWFASDMGAPGPNLPLRQEVLRRIAENPELTGRLIRVLDHDLRPSQLFGPATAMAATATVLRAHPSHYRSVAHETRSVISEEIRRWSEQRSAASRRRRAAT